MTKTITKTKSTAARKTIKVDEGVGFDATASTNGHCFENHPAVAVAIHPLRGIQIHGPFINAAAARAWIERDGDGSLMGCFGDVRSATWHVEGLDVPRCYSN